MIDFEAMNTDQIFRNNKKWTEAKNIEEEYKNVLVDIADNWEDYIEKT